MLPSLVIRRQKHSTKISVVPLAASLRTAENNGRLLCLFCALISDEYSTVCVTTVKLDSVYFLTSIKHKNGKSFE